MQGPAVANRSVIEGTIGRARLWIDSFPSRGRKRRRGRVGRGASASVPRRSRKAAAARFGARGGRCRGGRLPFGTHPRAGPAALVVLHCGMAWPRRRSKRVAVTWRSLPPAAAAIVPSLTPPPEAAEPSPVPPPVVTRPSPARAPGAAKGGGAAPRLSLGASEGAPCRCRERGAQGALSAGRRWGATRRLPIDPGARSALQRSDGIAGRQQRRGWRRVHRDWPCCASATPGAPASRPGPCSRSRPWQCDRARGAIGMDPSSMALVAASGLEPLTPAL